MTKVYFILLTTIGLLHISQVISEDSVSTATSPVVDRQTTASPLPQPLPSPSPVPFGIQDARIGRAPSIWSKTVHSMREKAGPQYKRRQYLKSTEMHPIPAPIPAPPAINTVDEETDILQSEPLLKLKDFANQVINETAALFKAPHEPRALFRSYPSSGVAAEDPTQQTQQQQFWGDDKDQAYHASSYSGLEYEPPTSYHAFPHSPHPLHYYPMPQKKDDTLLTKVALLALLKLILAKLKAIGFLKLVFLFMLKLPLFFFKLLIAIKGFKFIKLLSIPFLILAFALPFLPLIPFLAFAFLPLLLLIPLAIPLLLPLLMMLPIIPVTTPPTTTGRRKREISVSFPQSVTANTTWSLLDEKWKQQQQQQQQQGERKRRTFKTRSRPASSPRRNAFSRYEPFLNEEHSDGLLDLTQRVVQSQQCMERAACELASYNDSKIYQSAVIWALSKLQTYAPAILQRKIENYSTAYEKGIQRRSTDYCAERFKCIRPKIYLVQGPHSYNVI